MQVARPCSAETSCSPIAGPTIGRLRRSVVAHALEVRTVLLCAKHASGSDPSLRWGRRSRFPGERAALSLRPAEASVRKSSAPRSVSSAPRGAARAETPAWWQSGGPAWAPQLGTRTATLERVEVIYADALAA